MFNLLWKKLEEEKDESFKTIFYSQLFFYLVGDDHVIEAMKWLKDEKVRTPEGAVIEGIQLKQADRHAIIRSVFALPDFDQKEKDAILEEELKKDTSEKAKLLKNTCHALTPTKERKEQVWKMLYAEKQTVSFYERNALMSGFWHYKQTDLLKPYYEMFLKALPEIAERGDNDYKKAFVKQMCPSYGITVEFLNEMDDICKKYEGDLKYDQFVRALKDRAEQLRMQKEVKDFAAKK